MLMEAGQLMVDFEKGNGMENTKYSSISKTLEALKKINQQENEIVEYVKTQMKLHVFNAADSNVEKQLKEFFEYLNNQRQQTITLPSFNQEKQ